MAKGEFQQVANIGAVADFRLWVTNYRAALTAAGFVRTSDTGQIDPTTVALPTSQTVGGYEIWRFNDAAQATYPIFFKLEYGMGYTSGTPGFWLTVGTGSNGAGTITNIRIPRTSWYSNNYSATMGDCWVASGEGYLASGNFVGASLASTCFGWFIERLRLTTGLVDTTPLGAGIVVGTPGLCYVATYDGVWSDNGNYPVLTPNSTSSSYRGVVRAYPFYPIAGPVRGASRATIGSVTGDAGLTTPFTVSLYGAPHVFRGASGGSAGYGRGNQSMACMRYE